ncbi:hypothetical protein QQX09_12770 [Demequina sp. SYSU T00192]|uniref:Polyketide cyclase / dehydrase and lipid transport n=1 Tax=Demequina litoralis TaxID=3051660 RepID=A0ABT8GCE1_9MICO|nr:hypothetical protein [Demequina sp. SYSU T00192]MDN4476727.1 hypothetical protein [Demequina sp. SYSU T00192]
MTRQQFVFDARHAARLDASPDEIRAASLDVAWSGSAAGHEVRDLIESVPGFPHTWTTVVRAGILRQRNVSTLVSADPVVVRSEARDGALVQTSTTLVEPRRGADGLTGVAWHVRAELSLRDPLSRLLQRALEPRTARSFERQLAAQMARWGAAIEARARV